MLFKVYHCKNSTFGSGLPPEFNDENFELVAEIESPNSDDVFRITNHIDEAWWNNPEVRSYTHGSRSTSVGDIIVGDDDVRRRCENTGWTTF